MNKKIKVYSTPICPYCVALKNFLKEHEIEFEEIDVSQDEKLADELIKKSGQMGVPVMEVGDEIIVGFNRELITQILNLKD